MTLKNVTKAYHLPEQSVLTILIRENNLTLSCVQKRSYYPFMWRDNNPRNRVIPNTELQFDIDSVNAVTGRNYSQNFFTKCISYCVSLQQFFQGHCPFLITVAAEFSPYHGEQLGEAVGHFSYSRTSVAAAYSAAFRSGVRIHPLQSGYSVFGYNRLQLMAFVFCYKGVFLSKKRIIWSLLAQEESVIRLVYLTSPIVFLHLQFITPFSKHDARHDTQCSACCDLSRKCR